MGPHLCPPQAVNAALLQCSVCHLLVFGTPAYHAFALLGHITGG